MHSEATSGISVFGDIRFLDRIEKSEILKELYK